MPFLYRFHPASQPLDLVDARRAHASALQGLAIGLVIALPPIASAIGISSWAALGLVSTWVLWMEIVALGVGERARGSLGWARVLTIGNLLLGTGVSAGLAVATGRPETPLWALAVMYACFNGATIQLEPSVLCMLAHVGSVLLAIPVLLARGVAPREAIATPVVIASVCAVAYHFLAMRSHELRLAREEADRLRAQLDQERAERSRQRLARDLHDAVGANLSAAAVYADLLARAEDVRATRALADAVAASARQGLAELRGLLEGLAPHGVDAGAFGDALRAWGATVAGGAGLELAIEVDDPSVAIDAEARLALVRVFQESLQNAMKHARASRVSARLEAIGDTLRMTISDDGRGFDVAAASRGRGLRHLEERAREIGGRAAIRSGPSGTEIEIVLPHAVREEGSRERVVAQG